MAEYIERGLLKKAVHASDLENREKMALLSCISSIPAANVVPVRHGKWLLEPTNPYDDPGYKNRMIKVCSCCHWSNACKYNYCPNCGAKMDGRKEDG